ncbi:hypothetical protein CBR_g39701 [Chara braunii]|uniref:Uncharacterized protein n=1 Tax=Chara braunii TaxID=69332 RepID=A0A388LSA1_CHABU|nr:hypothetical protein CBR_g39701 [Chara braunii]|eukprot:GBG85135.1 hypothetical protein CBR_g39701 [Chara braunii]
MPGGQEQGVRKRQSKQVGATTSKKAKRPGGLTIREGQDMSEGDSARLGIAATREPSEKSKRKLAAEEDDGEKKPRRRKIAEGTRCGERAVGRQYDEAATFWLEYERNDDGEIVEKELPIQLLIDPRRVCDIPPWERYYNHRSFTRYGVDDMKGAMLRQFHEEKRKISTKNPLVLTPIYKPVTHKPERAERVYKDVFKPEDKDKYFYYPVNGQHTVAAVELAGEAIFELWKMHSWPARVVWFSDEDFRGYLQSLDDMTDAKKSSILEDILALRGLFVQSASGHLKRQHKPGIKDMVATRKVDRMMLRMFHYILFLESEEDAKVSRYGSQLFRTEEQLLAEFASRGLTKQVWVELRKHFHGAVEYVNTCKRCLSYEKKSLDETKKMYDDERFPKSFEKSVRSILRRTEEEVQDTIRVSGAVRHII